MNKKSVVTILIFSLVVLIWQPSLEITAAAKPKLTKSSVIVKVGDKETISIKNVKTKNVKSLKIKGTSRVSAKKISKTKFSVKGIKIGTSKVKSTLKLKKAIANKKTYTLSLTVRVKADTTEDLPSPTDTIATPTPTSPSQSTSSVPEIYNNYDMKKITLNGYSYNLCMDVNFSKDVIKSSSYNDPEYLGINMENDLNTICYLKSDVDYVEKNYSFFSSLGKITAVDNEGHDITGSIVLYISPSFREWALDGPQFITVYAQDERGNKIAHDITVAFFNNEAELLSDIDTQSDRLVKLSNPTAYAFYTPTYDKKSLK